MEFLFGGGFLIAFIVAILRGGWTLYGKRKQHNCTKVVQIFFQLSKLIKQLLILVTSAYHRRLIYVVLLLVNTMPEECLKKCIS